ncbi:MAG: hypothetical protein JWQ13_4109 [Ramlibacter sp.]|nr:hypothetical protein [Ramlibacter sp.]
MALLLADRLPGGLPHSSLIGLDGNLSWASADPVTPQAASEAAAVKLRRQTRTAGAFGAWWWVTFSVGLKLRTGQPVF